MSGVQPGGAVTGSGGFKWAAVPPKLVTWFFFGVVLGLLPFFFVLIKTAFSGGSFSLVELLRGGDLFIVSAAIAGAAIGDLLLADIPKGLNVYRGLAGFFCLMCCVGNAFAYSAGFGAAEPRAVVSLSVWLFVGAIISSFASVFMVAGR